MATVRLQKPLNILHVLRAPVGGLFRHVADLVRGQTARGHRVGIVADSLTGDAPSLHVLDDIAPQLALGLSRIPIPRPFGARDITGIWHVSRRIHDTKAAVVPGHGANGGAYARLALSSHPAVRAYTPHGGSLLFDDRSVRGKAYLALERLMVPRGDLYLFESVFGANAFHAKVGTPSGVARVVHNGVAEAEFAPVITAPGASDIIFLGELRPVKGIDTLIDAIVILHRGGMKVTATLVGGGPQAAELRARVDRINLQHAIRFMPPMPARAAMALGRVMLMPSLAESLPYVVLETAAAGKPLIASRVGGIPEIYGDLSGALVPPGDAQELADAIARAIRNPIAADALARALRERVAAEFAVETMVDDVLAGYAQALTHQQSPHLRRDGNCGAVKAHAPKFRL
jgi:glycosyltransferase involved in cell wall biosynthesis